jgi:hypothetical protein
VNPTKVDMSNLSVIACFAYSILGVCGSIPGQCYCFRFDNLALDSAFLSDTDNHRCSLILYRNDKTYLELRSEAIEPDSSVSLVMLRG